MEKIAVASQKGGPGKTTTTVNLAAGLALTGARVLVVDIEPQAQAGIALGVRLAGPEVAKSLGLRLQQAAQGVPSTVSDIVIDCSHLLEHRAGQGKLCLLASEQATMANAQHILHAAGIEKIGVLRTLLHELDDQFDYAVFDTPPAVQALNGVALAASDYALTLCLPKHATVEGAVTMRSTIRHVKERTNGLADPKYLGVVLNMSSPQREWTLEEIEVRNLMVDTHLAPFVTDIRQDTRISRSYATGMPAVLGFARHAPGKQYAKFLQETLDRMDLPPEEWTIAPSADEVIAAAVEAKAAKEKVRA
ncbi:ParA family protein [Streptomyces yaizuensis]|uniref:ParA family protein n=1 Tax=Streptomyces yaizuensis TaxID=2989713 RepID=A0ABQ5P6M6_9ACTN|nr:ParA family protein [Streptomyces sp. YSPA8]GLF98231.1 ParA family protein [Streptomyces sp. YSPA8]